MRSCLALGAPLPDHLSGHILVKAVMLTPEACCPRFLSYCLSSWALVLEALDTIQFCASWWGYGSLTRILEATG